MDFEALIGQVAFPILVSIWFMFRTEKVIIENTKATQQMNLTLEKLFFQKK